MKSFKKFILCSALFCFFCISFCCLLSVAVFVFVGALEIEPRALCMLCKKSTIELNPQLFLFRDGVLPNWAGWPWTCYLHVSAKYLGLQASATMTGSFGLSFMIEICWCLVIFGHVVTFENKVLNLENWVFEGVFTCSFPCRAMTGHCFGFVLQQMFLFSGLFSGMIWFLWRTPCQSLVLLVQMLLNL